MATASIVTDSDEATLVCIEGSSLESLFTSEPRMAGRFFAFLASYQAKRLRVLTSNLSKSQHEVAGMHLASVTIHDVFSNPAYMGIFRKFMSHTADEQPEATDAYAMSLAMFEFWMDVQARSRAACVHASRFGRTCRRGHVPPACMQAP